MPAIARDIRVREALAACKPRPSARSVQTREAMLAVDERDQRLELRRTK
jgi:hypothetical protein